MRAGETVDAQRLAAAIADLALAAGSPSIVGIAGAQGSGKSTLAAMVVDELEGRGVAAMALSLDDFYLTRADRDELGARIHPLCATRGVAGTHDIALLCEALDALSDATPEWPVRVPRFDKLTDDRLPSRDWQRVSRPPEIVLLEGWNVGLTRAMLDAWRGAANALEQQHDPHGAWRNWSREALREYEELWERLDRLVGLLLPDIDSIVAARLAQERALAQQRGNPALAMDEAQVRRFVAHFERQTLALQAALPAHADILAMRCEDFAYRILECPA